MWGGGIDKIPIYLYFSFQLIVQFLSILTFLLGRNLPLRLVEHGVNTSEDTRKANVTRLSETRVLCHSIPSGEASKVSLRREV